MQRINVDKSTASVKNFIRALAVVPQGVEVELKGRVVCTVMPTLQLADADKEALRKEALQLVRRAQERSKGVPARVIEREIRVAVDEVRGRKKR